MNGEYRFDFGQQHKVFWGCLPSETWLCDFAKAYPDVSKEHNVFILTSGLRPGRLPFSSNTLTSYSVSLVFKSWSRGWLPWFCLVCAGQFRYCTSSSVTLSQVLQATSFLNYCSSIIHFSKPNKIFSPPPPPNLQSLLPSNMHTEVSGLWLWR
jgi:hypothetical protein